MKKKRCLDVSIHLCHDHGEHWVDDIPGVSANLIHALRDDQAEQFESFFDTLKEKAYKRFKTDFQMALSRTKQFKSIISELPMANSARSHSIIEHHECKEGFVFKLPYHDYVSFDINSLFFQVHQAGKVQLFVYNLIDGDILFEKEYLVNKGKAIVPVNFKIESTTTTEVFIAIKNIDAVLLETSCKEVEDCNSCEMVCDTESDYGMVCDCEPVSCETIKYKHEKAFCIDATLRCDLEGIICRYAPELIEAYKYLVAMCIFEEKINSYTRGFFSDANSKQVKDETLPETKEYYYKLLDMAVNSLSAITDGSVCFECSATNSGVPQMHSY